MRLVKHFEPYGVPNVQYTYFAVVFCGEPALGFFCLFEISGVIVVVR